MKNKYLVLTGLFGLCMATVSQAGSMFSIKPVEGSIPRQVIGFGKLSFIRYIVTNNTGNTYKFNVFLPDGISENRPNIIPATLPLCLNKAVTGLGPQESCLLSLRANASTIKTIASGGPIISLGAHGFARFRPSLLDSLSVSVTPLNTSVLGLALSVNDVYTPFNALTGKPRKITLTSGSGADVSNVTFRLFPPLPDDASISPSTLSCGTISTEKPCTITITPGATATTSPSFLSVHENGRQSFTIPIHILTYGSKYQSGYVFAIDDTTPDSGSVGGKAITLQNQAPLFPAGIIWASNGLYNCGIGNYGDCTSYDVIAGINELSMQSKGDACNGSTDGACNTKVITNYLDNNNFTTPGTPVDPTKYAAGLCTATINYLDDWYLPAICEMGYFQAAPRTPNAVNNCGTKDAPLIQNMASNLPNAQLQTVQGPFWSSTEYSGEDKTTGNAWDEYFTTNVQTHDGKEDAVGVRCVRALTQSPG